MAQELKLRRSLVIPFPFLDFFASVIIVITLVIFLIKFVLFSSPSEKTRKVVVEEKCICLRIRARYVAWVNLSLTLTQHNPLMINVIRPEKSIPENKNNVEIWKNKKLTFITQTTTEYEMKWGPTHNFCVPCNLNQNFTYGCNCSVVLRLEISSLFISNLIINTLRAILYSSTFFTSLFSSLGPYPILKFSSLRSTKYHGPTINYALMLYQCIAASFFRLPLPTFFIRSSHYY